MIKRVIRRNFDSDIPNVAYIEKWFLDFPHFSIILRVNYIYDYGNTCKIERVKNH